MAPQIRDQREWVERDGRMFLRITTEARNIDDDSWVKIGREEHDTRLDRQQTIQNLRSQIQQLQSEVDSLTSR